MSDLEICNCGCETVDQITTVTADVKLQVKSNGDFESNSLQLDVWIGDTLIFKGQMAMYCYLRRTFPHKDLIVLEFGIQEILYTRFTAMFQVELLCS